MCVQWKVNRSPVYTFLTKISHDVTMNPYWTHLCQKALLQPSLPLYASFSVPPLPPPCSVLTSWIFQAHPPFFWYFHILQTSLLLSVPHAFLSSWLTLFFFRHLRVSLIYQSALTRQKCQDVVILINFVRAAFFTENSECMGASQRIKAYGKKTGMGRTQTKERRENTGEKCGGGSEKAAREPHMEVIL